MGADNRKRRAARERRRDRGGAATAGETWDADRVVALVAQRALVELQLLGRNKPTEAALAHAAGRLVASSAPYPAHVVEVVLQEVADPVVRTVVDGGWSPADLAELVARNLGATHLPTLADALRADEEDHPRGQAWRDAIEAVDGGPAPGVAPGGAVASWLGLLALLQGVPLLTDAIAATAADAGPEHPKLARVRALLAKAESTEFDEEAEALSAKAQELISRYALDRLLEAGPARDSGDLQVRRLWLDAPYVRAKMLLVSSVSSANRCRAASADRLGFSVVVGSAADLDAVELLITSLLVQADAAMLRHGRRATASGAARTKSFRQSFLMAYATRIGERLAEVNAAAARAAGADLLPVLRSQEEKVAEEFDRLVPHTTSRARSISNGEGWVAGLAAADVAELGVSSRLDQAG